MGQEVSAPAPTQTQGEEPIATIADLQNASIAPITPAETALWARAGKACCWKDAGEYSWRLRQLEIINHAIKILAQETWKDPLILNFKTLHQDVMNYKDVDGNDAEFHEWSLISDDVTFKPMELSQNRFKEFENYFQTKSGATNQKMKEDFDAFMLVFIRLRDGLMNLMVRRCIPAPDAPPPVEKGSWWK